MVAVVMKIGQWSKQIRTLLQKKIYKKILRNIHTQKI